MNLDEGASEPNDVIARLLDEYVTSAIAHGQATLSGANREGGRHADNIARLYSAIRSLGTVARQSLLALLEHNDHSVRVWAAAHSLEYAPEMAKPVLEVEASRPGMIGFSAKMTLEEWRKGRLHFP